MREPAHLTPLLTPSRLYGLTHTRVAQREDRQQHWTQRMLSLGRSWAFPLGRGLTCQPRKPRWAQSVQADEIQNLLQAGTTDDITGFNWVAFLKLTLSQMWHSIIIPQWILKGFYYSLIRPCAKQTSVVVIQKDVSKLSTDLALRSRAAGSVQPLPQLGNSCCVGMGVADCQNVVFELSRESLSLSLYQQQCY